MREAENPTREAENPTREAENPTRESANPTRETAGRGSWSRRAHVEFVLTAALATFVPALAAAFSGPVPWLWVGFGVVGTSWAHLKRQNGGVTGVTTPAWKRFLHVVFVFNVTVGVSVVVAFEVIAVESTTAPGVFGLVLLPGVVLAALAWLALTVGGEVSGQ